MSIKNSTFAEKVGCSESMASYLRNGQRSPSTALSVRIRKAYKLDPYQWWDAISKGDEAVGRYLRKYVFDADSATVSK